MDGQISLYYTDNRLTTSLQNSLYLNLPIFVALYTFSILNTPPKPYNKTFAKAGTSCVVVTSTFTQLDLQNNRIIITGDQ
jgi:hypothetical protein